MAIVGPLPISNYFNVDGQILQSKYIKWLIGQKEKKTRHNCMLPTTLITVLRTHTD